MSCRRSCRTEDRISLFRLSGFGKKVLEEPPRLVHEHVYIAVHVELPLIACVGKNEDPHHLGRNDHRRLGPGEEPVQSVVQCAPVKSRVSRDVLLPCPILFQAGLILRIPAAIAVLPRALLVCGLNRYSFPLIGLWTLKVGAVRVHYPRTAGEHKCGNKGQNQFLHVPPPIVLQNSLISRSTPSLTTRVTFFVAPTSMTGRLCRASSR